MKKQHDWYPFAVDKEKGFIFYKCGRCKKISWEFLILSEWREKLDKKSCGTWPNEEL